MTQEEIAVFADQITHINQRTELFLKNGTTVSGHFDQNADYELRKNNQWNFVVLPQMNPHEKKTTMFNGEDILNIKIH